MARILFLAHRIPYPPNKGDKIRSWNFLKHLLDAHEVHAAFFVDDKQDLEHLPFLEERCESVCHQFASPLFQKMMSIRGMLRGTSLTENAYPSPLLRRHVARLIEGNKVDLVFCYSAASFGFLPADLCGIPVITDLVDVDSAKWMAYAQNSSGIKRALFAREARTLARFEAGVVQSSNASLLVSEDEATLMRNNLKKIGSQSESVSGISNGVDCDAFSPDRYQAPIKGKRLIFTGAMDYQPNVDAVVWFAENVMRQLRIDMPDVKFIIAGRPVAQAVRNLDAIDGVNVLGGVEDMAAEIAKADIVLAPLQTARGIQNKVLEGMAMQKPVVATWAANEGINAPDREAVWIAETPDDYINAIKKLLGPSCDNTLGNNARRFVLDSFTWSSSFKKLDNILNRLLLQSAAREKVS